MDNECVLNLMLTPDGTFWFDILEGSGTDMAEITHGFTVDAVEVPAVTLTMMEIQLQEASES